MTYHLVCNKSNTTGATSGAGTAYPKRRSSSLVFNGARVDRSLVFYVVFRVSLFVTFLLSIVLSDLVLYITSDYRFGILKSLVHDLSPGM